MHLSEFFVSEAFVICLVPAPKEDTGLFRAYLVEPLCASTSVIKFSGTPGTSHHTDKLASTISAFAHFIAGHTACKTVFANLQGLSFDLL